jgi:hypothetical protein
MEQIEKALGRQIIRIETNDLDEMEEVCAPLANIKPADHFLPQTMKKHLK